MSIYIFLVGTLLQYAQYSIYSLDAKRIAMDFVSGNDLEVQLLDFFKIFAISVAARPMGSLLFSSLAKRYTRRACIAIAMCLGGVSSMGVAFAPSVHQLGIWAAILFVALRMTFVASLAGELDGVRIYIFENITKQRNFFSNALVTAATQAGVMISFGLLNWFNFRVCFGALGIGSIVLGFTVIKLPLPIGEKKPIFDLQLRQLWKGSFAQIALVAIVSGLLGGMYNYLIAFAPHHYHYESKECIILAFTFGVLLFGFLSDRKPYWIVLVPLFALIASIMLYLSHDCVCLLVIALCAGGLSATLHVLLAQRLNVAIRYPVFTIGHSMGSVFISGTAPYVAQLLAQNKIDASLYVISANVLLLGLTSFLRRCA